MKVIAQAHAGGGRNHPSRPRVPGTAFPAADVVRRIEAAVSGCARDQGLVLAVSGGLDSMVLLHASARSRHSAIRMVATFDHGTGAAAERAAALVAREAAALGFPVVHGRSGGSGSSEAEWRALRWAFLSRIASDVNGVVVTAHTRDDQLETVLMRVLRGAGPRGLAALYAGSAVARPLLEFTRAEIVEYARVMGVDWIDDPTNDSHAYLRNRVRRQLLPALRAARPSIERELLDVARDAADVRRRVDDIVARVVTLSADGRAATVPRSWLMGRSQPELFLLWPALAAQVGVAMDRRGTRRAAEFTIRSRAGARMPLSGGWEISRSRDQFELRRNPGNEPSSTSVRLVAGARLAGFRFDRARRADDVDPWAAQLPPEAVLTVRAWCPGDRMVSGGMTRKVKRFLSDARISGTIRGSWPVVLAGDQVVWIPGVRRSDAVAVRPGRPGVLYRCELDSR